MRTSSALARLPARSCGSNGSARWGSVRGSHVSSMPFRMPVRPVDAAEIAGGNAGQLRETPDHADRIAAFQDLRVAGHEDAHVVVAAQGARQRGRHFAEPARLHVVGNLGGDIENALARRPCGGMRGRSGALAGAPRCTRAPRLRRSGRGFRRRCHLEGYESASPGTPRRAPTWVRALTQDRDQSSSHSRDFVRPLSRTL